MLDNYKMSKIGLKQGWLEEYISTSSIDKREELFRLYDVPDIVDNSTECVPSNVVGVFSIMYIIASIVNQSNLSRDNRYEKFFLKVMSFKNNIISKSSTMRMSEISFYINSLWERIGLSNCNRLNIPTHVEAVLYGMTILLSEEVLMDTIGLGKYIPTGKAKGIFFDEYYDKFKKLKEILIDELGIDGIFDSDFDGLYKMISVDDVGNDHSVIVIDGLLHGDIYLEYVDGMFKVIRFNDGSVHNGYITNPNVLTRMLVDSGYLEKDKQLILTVRLNELIISSKRIYIKGVVDG